MACESSLLDVDSMFDDTEEEEDWMSTDWADPTPSVAHQSLHCQIKKSPPASDAELSSHTNIKTGKSTEEEKGKGEVVQRMLLNDNKAGMEGLDKEKINQIIHEASKGSKFYENERQKEKQMKRRIEEQRQKIQQISAELLRQGTTEADRLLEDFEQQRDLSRSVVHIDMDAFYAAVEMRDDPSLKTKPMAVGGNSMLSTSNYHARKFGVRAAMPGFIGRKLCPELVIVPLNFEKYTAASKQVKTIMSEYDPNFCPMSLDEAYLDLTEHLQNRRAMSVDERTFICRDSKYTDSRAHCKCDLNEIARNYGNSTVFQDGSDLNEVFSKTKQFDALSCTEASLDNTEKHGKSGSSIIICPVCHKELPPFKRVTFGLNDEDAVNELRTRIEQKTTLTASAGIAPNMMLAKVCSDKNKPNGQYKIKSTPEDVMNFIKDLPTRKISGIGKVSEAMLNAVGVYTCTDLYEKRGLLYHLYSQISFNYFMRICLGIGSTTVERDSERKSISTERTFSELSKPADLYQKCEELCQSLAEDLKSEQLMGKTVSIKIKTVRFEVRTRAHTVRDYTNDYDDIVRSATELLRTEIQNCAPQPLRLRLMGVRMSNLIHESICQKKKQNTIIGAFKRLATSSKTESNTKTSGSIDQSQVENGPAKMNLMKIANGEMDVSETTKIVSGEMDVSVTEVKLINVFHSTEWKSASDVIDDIVTNKNSAAKEIHGTTNLNEQELVNSESTRSSCNLLDCGNEVSRNETNFSITEKSVVERKVESKAKDSRDTENYIGDKDIDHVDDKDTSDRIANVNKSSHNIVNEKEVNDVSNKGPSQDKVNSSVFSPNIRRTRSGLLRTPASQSKRKNKRNRNKVKTEDSAVVYTCPVCALSILCEHLQSFNEHVDMCLESGEPDEISSPSIDNLNAGHKSKSDNERNTVSNNALEGDETKGSLKTFVNTENQRENFEDEAGTSVQGSIKELNEPEVVDTGNNDMNFDVEIEIVRKLQPTVTLMKNTDVVKDSELNTEESDDAHDSEIRTEADEVEGCISVSESEIKMLSGDTSEHSKLGPRTKPDGQPALPEREISDSENLFECKEISVSLIPLSPKIVIENSTETLEDDMDSSVFGQSNEIRALDIRGAHEVDSVIGREWPQKSPVRKKNVVISDEIEELSEDDATADIKGDVDGESEGALLVCPVCNVQQRSADLNAFNSHVDVCLSRGTISQILKEQKKQNNGSVKRNRPTTPGSSKSVKRRRTVMPDSSKPCISIASFFLEK